ncbi:hypothetical protein Adt_29991 [Abeliophyllum distichum]|uniref:Uncharacterized protein n=1 Tax=Abeliophyllum distichum TaxID=126358 RepID=A0ABD1R9Y8_9LAMI
MTTRRLLLIVSDRIEVGCKKDFGHRIGDCTGFVSDFSKGSDDNLFVSNVLNVADIMGYEMIKRIRGWIRRRKHGSARFGSNFCCYGDNDSRMRRVDHGGGDSRVGSFGIGN